PTNELRRRPRLPHTPRQVSVLLADRRPPPPRDSATHLHLPLQPRAPPPRTRAALAGLAKRGAANDRQPDQAPRPTRRTNPRIPPHRRMNRHFETPQGKITPDVADFAWAFANVGFANAWIAVASFALCSGWV